MSFETGKVDHLGAFFFYLSGLNIFDLVWTVTIGTGSTVTAAAAAVSKNRHTCYMSIIAQMSRN